MPRAGLAANLANPMARSAGFLAPLVVVAALAGVTISAEAQSFTLLNAPPEAGTSFAFGLSDDGRSVAGWKSGPAGFLWTAGAGRNDFGIGLNPTQGRGISGDGRVVVGGGGPGSGAFAFRWSATGGYQNLGTLPGFAQAMAHDANVDGSIVVGTLESTLTNGTPQAFRWTASGGMQGLGVGTRANAISGDGSVIVGTLSDQPRAMRWTQAGGAQQLPSLGGSGASHARAINFDGSIIVGNSGPTFRPTMWINGSPTELQSTIVNSTLTPFGVSDDGMVVGGQVQGSGGSTFAGVWTQSTGIVRLTDYLTSNGVSLPAGIVLESCTSVSSDGRTFAGFTTNTSPGSIQGWVATVPTPCPADLDNDGSLTNGGTRDRAVTIDDLLYLLVAFESGNLAADLDNGSNTGTRDNAVTIDDLLYFLSHFEAGC